MVQDVGEGRNVNSDLIVGISKAYAWRSEGPGLMEVKEMREGN